MRCTGRRGCRPARSIVGHALGTARILDAVRADASARAAGLLFAAAERLAKPEEQLKENFGDEIATIAIGVRQLARLGNARSGPSTRRPVRRSARRAARRRADAKARERQAETLRKMLLAFSTDIRVVLVRLASRLQTLRWYAEIKKPLAEWTDPGIARESLELYAPLANRLGVWQIKWEIEDLSFRFLDPDAYKRARGCSTRSGSSASRSSCGRRGSCTTCCGGRHRVDRHRATEAPVQHRRQDASKKLSFENLYDVRACA